MTTFAERLNLLFATFLQPAADPGRRREEWSNVAVARVAAELHGGDHTGLTRQYIGMLRGGDRVQPSLRATNALADAFAELAGRSGQKCNPVELLVFLAGRSALASSEPIRGTDSSLLVQAVMTRRADETGEGHDEAVEGPNATALRGLIEELSRPESERARRKLARLLRWTGPTDESR